MRTVEVFKTNIGETVAAKQVTALLLQHFPESRITFDLEDCDKVLRIEGTNLTQTKVIKVVTQRGYDCCVLD
jgi:hypothetical protein